MIVDSLAELNMPAFLNLKNFIHTDNFYIKLEGLNVAGSIKLKAAQEIFSNIESENLLNESTRIVCSSSGNLGVALSIICKSKHIPFTCVTDKNIIPTNEELIKIYGGQVIKIEKCDNNGGFVKNRLEIINEMISKNANVIWVNQYANPANPMAHYQTTAPEIIKELKRVDWLFIGAGTTGTLVGCSRYFKEKFPATRIVAVDIEGSVTFKRNPQKRCIPGIGASRRPELVNEAIYDEVVYVSELETITMADFMLEEYGQLWGGSTASVLSAVKKKESIIKSDERVVMLSPDFGERYLTTLYSKDWRIENFPRSFCKKNTKEENKL
jgi:cysteine synthase A